MTKLNGLCKRLTILGVLLHTTGLMAMHATGDHPACAPSAGDCCTDNGTPGCDDPKCCHDVCAVDPFCCDNQWDSICADEAEDLCGKLCGSPGEPCDCPLGALEEGEPCGDDSNGGCNSEPPVFTDASCGQTFCGSAWAENKTRDTDWYLVTVDDPDGDGFAVIKGALFSEFNGVCLIVGGIDTCKPIVLGSQGASSDCQNFVVASATVEAPGTYVVFVATANFIDIPCGSSNSYTLEITCEDEGDGEINCEDTECENSGDTQLSQSDDCEIVNDAGIACSDGVNTTANQFARSYTMDFDLSITCVGFGVETNSGFAPHPARINVYLDTDGGAPQAAGIDLELLASVDVPVIAPLTIHYGNFDPPIDVFAGQVIVVEFDVTEGMLSIPQTSIFPGSNLSDQSGPSYIKAEDCGVNEYVDLADLGFPDSAYVNTINGFADSASPPCPWDVNGDGVVDHHDIVEVVHNLGLCDDPDDCPWDVNGDDIVNGKDVAAVAMHFGACPKE